MKHVLEDTSSVVFLIHNFKDVPKKIEVIYTNFPLQPTFTEIATLQIWNRNLLLTLLENVTIQQFRTIYLNQMDMLEAQRQAVQWLEHFWRLPYRELLADFRQKTWPDIMRIREMVGDELKEDIDYALRTLQDQLKNK